MELTDVETQLIEDYRSLDHVAQTLIKSFASYLKGCQDERNHLKSMADDRADSQS